jgi:hypothetical protein
MATEDKIKTRILLFRISLLISTCETEVIIKKGRVILNTRAAMLFLTCSVITFSLVATTPTRASNARIKICEVIIEKYIDKY